MFEQIVHRIFRLAKFDWAVFPEIAHDEKATQEAAIVVLIAGLLFAVGWILGGIGTFLLMFVLFVGLWLLWSCVSMLVGAKLFGSEVTFWGMARTLGYASAPMALCVLGSIPCLGWVVLLISTLLWLVLGFFAVRETPGLKMGQAMLTALIGWVAIPVVYLIAIF